MSPMPRLLMLSLVGHGQRPPSRWRWVILALLAALSFAWCILG